MTSVPLPDTATQITGDTGRDTYPSTTAGTGDTGPTDTGPGCIPGPTRRLVGELDLGADAWATVTSAAGSDFGFAVAGLGDVTGDGADDLAVQTLGEAIGTDVGGVYLLPSPLGAGNSDARTLGVRLVDATPGTGYDYWVGAGYGTMVPLGDLDGDALTEVALSARTHVNWPLQGQGIVYVLGSPVVAAPGTTWPLAPSYGRIVAADALDFGWSMAAGDVDADGLDDLLVGAPDGGNGRGDVWVFRGPHAAGSLDERDAAFAIHGDDPLLGEAEPFSLGTQVVVGDSTGDGVDDVVATCSAASTEALPFAGAAYAFDGPLTQSVSTSAADGTLQGEEEGGALGVVSAWLGDTDGDGYGEFGVGAIGAGGIAGIGHVYLLDGEVAGVVSASTRADTHLYGLAPGDQAFNVASAGDLDQDGFDDVAVAATAVDGDSRGAVFLYYGPVALGGFGVDAIADVTIRGAAGGDWPIAVAAAGDLDDDCMPDLVVGAQRADAAYILRGGTY